MYKINKKIKIAILTSPESWFVKYSKDIVNTIKLRGYSARLFLRYEDIPSGYDAVFMLSYFRLVPDKFLKMCRHNIVIHESDLPKGRGWAPLFWQILEGKNRVPVVLFEATKDSDSGNIYLKDSIAFDGSELHDEIRHKQAIKTKELCLRFLKNMNSIRGKTQKGIMSFYRRRVPADSELDINKSIKSQFNQLRIADNVNYPAFFYHKNNRYILKISKEDGD